SNIMDNSGIHWVLLFTFIVYAALEISQNKGFKGFWKTAVRFAAVFGACMGFFAIVKSTNAFNMYKSLPSASSVKEVRLSGEYFYNANKFTGNQYVLDTNAAVSDILNEHKTLLNSYNIHTGKELKIVYVMKNGQEVIRNYSVNDKEDDVIKSFSNTAKNLPDFDFGDLGIIDEPDLTNYTFELINNGKPRKFIREEKLPELAELLRNDIKNNYSLSGYDNYYGRLMITEKNQKHDFDNDYYVCPSYTATIKFLENPENYTIEEIRNDVDKYIISYGSENVSVRVYVSTEDTNPAAKELLSYIKPKEEVEDYDPSRDVRFTSIYTHISYTVAPEHRERAKELLLEIFLDKH
ncbi:MAG: hypothetical protein K2J77_00480, partial [Oscillospiraceae bacterium]|nr:hypothetical protein [Oscillospiraceae bacterium]